MHTTWPSLGAKRLSRSCFRKKKKNLLHWIHLFNCIIMISILYYVSPWYDPVWLTVLEAPTNWWTNYYYVVFAGDPVLDCLLGSVQWTAGHWTHYGSNWARRGPYPETHQHQESPGRQGKLAQWWGVDVSAYMLVCVCVCVCVCVRSFYHLCRQGKYLHQGFLILCVCVCAVCDLHAL